MSTIPSIGSFMNRLRTPTHQDPVRDWLILISASLTILAGVVAWNAWTFSTTEAVAPSAPSVATTSEIFSRSSLDTITAIFTSRAEEEHKYSAGIYHYGDPSL